MHQPSRRTLDAYDQTLDSILPKTDWETRMSSARAASARMRAEALSDRAKSTGQRRPSGSHTGGGESARRPSGSHAGGAESARRPSGSHTGGTGSARRPQAARAGVYDRGPARPSGRQRRPMARPATASQLSREFADDDHRRTMKPKKKKTGRSLKIIAAALVLCIIIGSVFLIVIYTQGSSSNKRGLKLYADGDYAGAAEAFASALEKDGENSEYYVNLGMTYIALGNYEDALVAFDQAAAETSRPDLLELVKRGSGIVYLSSGHYAKAADLFKEALSYAGDAYGETEIDLLYYLAEALERAGDTVGAADSYSQIIEYQEDADAYMLRGLAYQSAGDNEKAEADLKTALNMSKKNYKIYLALYEVLMAQDKSQEAAGILEDALNLGGKTGEDYSNRGIVYMYQEDYANAADAFNKALEMGYNNAYLGLAQSYERQGDYESAAGYYENYIAADTTNAAAYNQYGLCLMALKQYADAQTAFETGLALNDRLVDRELMFNAAVALEYQEEWAQAYEQMKAFNQKYPDDARGQHELTFLESTQIGTAQSTPIGTGE